MDSKLMRFITDEAGSSGSEYAVILAVVGTSVIAGLGAVASALGSATEAVRTLLLR